MSEITQTPTTDLPASRRHSKLYTTSFVTRAILYTCHSHISTAVPSSSARPNARRTACRQSLVTTITRTNGACSDGIYTHRTQTANLTSRYNVEQEWLGRGSLMSLQLKQAPTACHGPGWVAVGNVSAIKM